MLARPERFGYTLQSGSEDARSMEGTTMYNGSNMPFCAGIGAALARHGRFASQTGWIGAATGIRIVTLPRVADVPGSSVPNGRRLRR